MPTDFFELFFLLLFFELFFLELFFFELFFFELFLLLFFFELPLWLLPQAGWKKLGVMRSSNRFMVKREVFIVVPL